MAEAKYDLLLVNTKTDKKIYNQPWYKERLMTRYIKGLKPTDTSQFLMGRNWTFVKDGLDDFRDGLPPPVEGGVVIKGPKSIAPNIQGSSDDVSSVKQPAVRGRFNKHQVCFSRVTPQQQERREHIEEIEYGLMQHPLALYPHLEECMPPDVFEDVVDILDPEMNLASEEDGEEVYDEEEDGSESDSDGNGHHQGEGDGAEDKDGGTEESQDKFDPKTSKLMNSIRRVLPALRLLKSSKTAKEILALATPEVSRQVKHDFREFCCILKHALIDLCGHEFPLLHLISRE